MKRLGYLAGIGGSGLLILLAAVRIVPFELSLLEAVGAVTYAWSVALLAANRPLGWWVGLVGVTIYAIVFYQVRLYAEVGIQAFYFVTSVQAIFIWLRGGQDKSARPVGRVPWRWLLATAALAVATVFGLRTALIAVRGAAPFWDALTTVLSLIAHLYLMGRYVESWYIWIAVDAIYVPLYASRGLYVTSILYGVFFVMAIQGLRVFRRTYVEQQQRFGMGGNAAIMTLGITVGKFYPFHLGHDHLIRTAKAQVEHLVVLVGFKSSQQIPGQVRAGWIRTMHPDVEVMEVSEDIPETPELWAQRALDVLGGRRPNVAFTSEPYGEPWATAMGARNVVVDVDRKSFPVSGRQLRADLGTHWHMLTPPAMAFLAKRVCIIGVESSGTTTLARSLAEHFRTVWVPEYGRWYWEGRRYTPDSERWDSHEFVRIAKRQTQWEDNLATRANQLLICDTDALATHVWHRRYLGSYSRGVEDIADSRHYNLYILTEPDFGFIQDGTREGERIRRAMHEWLIEVLTEKGREYITVSGSHEDRLYSAVRTIDPILAFPPLDEP